MSVSRQKNGLKGPPGGTRDWQHNRASGQTAVCPDVITELVAIVTGMTYAVTP
jgi:hypothetical protein